MEEQARASVLAWQYAIHAIWQQQANQLLAARAPDANAASSPLDAASTFAEELTGGFVDSAVGSGEFLLSLSPHNLLTDPEGYGETWSGLAGGLASAVHDPVGALRSAVSWDTWADNPGRALGNTLFGVVPGAGIAGKLGRLKRLDNLANTRREGCFLPGTPVLTELGLRAIETVVVGDRVVATEPESGAQGLHQVVSTLTHTVFDLVDLEIAGSTLSCSPEHPFWLERTGWAKAADITVGDVVLDAARQRLRVDARSERTGVFTVHNLEVAGPHTYHVSPHAILVHNKPRRAPEPKGTPKKVDTKWLKRHGVDPHEVKDDLPGAVSKFDIHLDQDGNMYGVRKGADPKSGEFLGNVEDYK